VFKKGGMSMNTPNKYKEKLNNQIITEEMLADALFSVNKRAKNCRDQEANNRFYLRDCGYGYRKYAFRNIKNYKEKKEYYYGLKETLLSVVSPCGIHFEFWENGEKRYYLFYKIGERSFHTPVSEEVAKQYSLPTTELVGFKTSGDEIINLISVDFVKKVVALVESGNYQYAPVKQPDLNKAA